LKKIVTIMITLLASLVMAQDLISLPTLNAIDLHDRKLRVVATTAIIADVVKNVGGDLIDLKTIIKPGMSAHAYKPTARELVKAGKADIIFTNGWGLEENLLNDLKNIVKNVPLVAVSAGIKPILKGEQADPHSWLSVDNVIAWTANIEKALSSLDPQNAAEYQQNSKNYRKQLQDLKRYAEKEISKIRPEKRLLITNHDAFSYFARDYSFKVPATIIPSMSALAEPSARDLASLIEVLKKNNICTIFSETENSDKLAKSIARELDNCKDVRVLPLQVGTFAEGSSYIEMFKENIDTIVKGLAE